MSKTSLRKYFLELRSRINADTAHKAAELAAGNFLKNIDLENISSVGLYYPLAHELNPLPLLEKLAAKGIITALPVIVAKNAPLEFHQWKYGDELLANSHYPKILEPLRNSNPITPDIIIVPLVAFDAKLHRLGYGAGFYDRTLQEIRGNGLRDKGGKTPSPLTPYPLTIGYAYECQRSENLLPAEENDMHLDGIVTENNLIIL